MRIPFATQSYKHPSLPISAQQCINFYAEREPPDAKTEGQVAVLSVPGVASNITTNPTGPVRGIHIIQDEIFIVSGTQLYVVSVFFGAATLVGSGITNVTANVAMADNGTQLIIVTFDGTSGGGWIYNRFTNIFGPITDPNFTPGYSVSFYDGYFIVPQGNTTTWRFSAILDGTTWGALDFNSAIVDSSLIQAITTQQENLLIFKEHVIETWYDTGNNDDPFQRYDGATIERGCAFPRTVVKEDNSVFFMGDDYIFYRLDGVLPRRVSTHALEALWKTFIGEGVADAYAYSYTWNGHKFVNLIFPTYGMAFIYDIATGLWHERNSYNSNGNFFPLWRQSYAASFLDYILVGDNQSGQVGFLQDTAFTEFGNQIIGELVSPPLEKDRKRVFLPLFELDIEAGVGTGVVGPGLGFDPQFMLQISRDGGRTYGSLQQWQSMGQQGEFLTRLRWKKLGQARQFVIKVQVSDPVPRRIIGAYGTVMLGM